MVHWCQGGGISLRVAEETSSPVKIERRKPEPLDDMDTVHTPSAGVGTTVTESGGFSAQSRIAPSDRTCMLESESKPRKGVPLECAYFDESNAVVSHAGICKGGTGQAVTLHQIR